YARHPPLPANDPWSRREPDEADYRGFVYIIGWIGPSVHDNARMPSAPEPPLHGVQGIVPRRPVIGAAPPPPAPPSGPARAGYQVVAVVFTHNRYKEAASTKGGGRRYRSAENVVTMANVPKVYERLFAHRYAPSCVYVGADWNQAPIVAREEWLQPIAAQPAAPAAPGPGGWPPPPPPGTTKFGGHHLYDWWFAAGNHRFPIPAGQQPASVLPDPLVTPAGAAAGVQAQIPWPVPTAYTEATGPTTSDHAAIALQIQ
ncbi:MAG TPA: hypothetical protein VFP34_05765, partial [Microlunatus sp.]|nr:hypothetical protein [Microlunatus sp.]